MILQRFDNYAEAEESMVMRIIHNPDFVTKTTRECIGVGFVLTNPRANRNGHSNYEYAQHFFEWLMTGKRELSEQLLKDNPWVQRFVDSTGLPDNFSASYGWKIHSQLESIYTELKTHGESRRAYLSILLPDDHIIRTAKTTHEYPCTIGLHFFIRSNRLHLVANMRSNNVYRVMPYDVYNFTMLQITMAMTMELETGYYFHQINSAHIFKGDVRRIREDGYGS